MWSPSCSVILTTSLYLLTAVEEPKVACHPLNEEGSSGFASMLTCIKPSNPAVSEPEGDLLHQPYEHYSVYGFEISSAFPYPSWLMHAMPLRNGVPRLIHWNASLSLGPRSTSAEMPSILYKVTCSSTRLCSRLRNTKNVIAGIETNQGGK